MGIEINNQPDIFQQLYSHAKDVSLLKKALDSALLKIARTEFEVLMKLVLAAEHKGTDNSLHIHRIGYMAELLCTLMKQPPEFCFHMRLASPMHDVGKLGIPDSILQKTGNYNDTERYIMNQHPIIGAKILDISNHALFQLASKIALSHHEKFDGSGYPYGLAGENIPFVGRIVAIVDFYDAVTRDRYYRKACSDQAALEMLEAQKNMHFDPDMVHVFIKHHQKFIDLKEKVNRTAMNFDRLIVIDLVKQVI